MSDLFTRYVTEADVAAERTWQLLEWCRSHGADAFTVSIMGIADAPAPACDAFEAASEPWYLGSGRRAVLANPDGADGMAVVPAWRLRRETFDVLRRYFGETLLSYELDTGEGWLEDPVVWRESEIMVAVISHEQEGILRLTESEHTALAAELGVVSHAEGQWVRY